MLDKLIDPDLPPNVCRSYVRSYRQILEQMIAHNGQVGSCDIEFGKGSSTADLQQALYEMEGWEAECDQTPSQSASSPTTSSPSPPRPGPTGIDIQELRRELSETRTFYKQLIYGVVAGFTILLGATYAYFSYQLRSLRQPIRVVGESLTTMFRRQPPQGGGGWGGGTVAQKTAFQTSATRARSGKGYKLIPLDGGRAISLDDGQLSKKGVVVGRSSGCDVELTDKLVSGRHARIWCDQGGSLRVEDLGSSNGTWKGGSRVQRAGLSPGDEIRFGASKFRVQGD